MAKISLKKLLGGIAAAGMALGGLVLAGKSEFGKNLGERNENDEALEPSPALTDPVDATVEVEPEDPTPEAEE